MVRTFLDDSQFEKIRGALLSAGAYFTENLRNRCEAIVYRIRTGIPWRDLPSELGPWQSAYCQFKRWSNNGVIEKVFWAIRPEPDLEYVAIDGSYIKVHQDGSGGQETKEEAKIGPSRGGNTTKVHALCDALGNIVDFEVTPGNTAEVKVAPELIKNCGAEAILADKGYDSEELREEVRKNIMIPMIPRKKNSKKPNLELDPHTFKARYLVENLFQRLKRFRAISTRFDRNSATFIATLRIGFILDCLR